MAKEIVSVIGKANSRFSKNHIPHNKGVKGFKNSGTFNSRDSHPFWSGEFPEYSAIHKWIVRNYGRANTCLNCTKIAKRFDWANIDGKYSRNIEEWIQLCRSCHMLFDRHEEVKNNILNKIKSR